MTFTDRAAALAGQAGWLLGWTPTQFWAATPAELMAVLSAVATPNVLPPDPQTIAALKEAFPDG